MTREQTFVIVGASLAGAKAAGSLRYEGFEGRLLLIGADRYDRVAIDDRRLADPDIALEDLAPSREGSPS